MSKATYTYVSQRGNSFLSRGYYETGERFDRKDGFSPVLFTNAGRGSTPWKDIHGAPVYEQEFDNVAAAREWMEQYSGVDGFTISGMSAWVSQFMAHQYGGELHGIMQHTRGAFIDIETTVDGSFPAPERADQEILLITWFDTVTKQYRVYASRDFDKTLWAENERFQRMVEKGMISLNQIKPVICRDEYHMLKQFVMDWATYHPDYITGWNTEFFDIPYLVNRISRVIGEEFAANLSPWKKLRARMLKRNDEEVQTYVIDGVSGLDFMALMRKFTYGERASWKLGNVAEDELGETKLELEGSFQDQYTSQWDNFVLYNVIDVLLVERLEQKMKLIELAYTVAYMAHINPDEVFSPIRTWDSIIYHHLNAQHVVVPFQKRQSLERQIAGGYVKDPQIGKHKWAISLDYASLYPHLMMWGNISPDRIQSIPFCAPTVDGILDRKYDLNGLKELNVAMLANGQTFSRHEDGFVPALIEGYYSLRKTVKKEMLAAEQEYINTNDPALPQKIASLNAKQMAVKIL